MYAILITSLGRFPFREAKIEMLECIILDNEPIPMGIPQDEGSPSGSKSVFKPATFYNPRDEL